jgi:pimeloyl-ACP methyl ester carboxylesterase
MVSLCVLLLSVAAGMGSVPFEDRAHDSRVFGQPRHYRLFLPGDYASSDRTYPVVYYFHGHSDRYTLEHYDGGTDTVPRIASFVARHDLIVVSVDGWVPEHYTGFYGGDPWDVREEGGQYDFGDYFLELASHIDGTLRTRTDRRHRATSGLSMGGFMSLYLSARYPDLVGSASAFNPGPEFYVGEPGRRVLWRPKDHVAGHAGRWVRLIRASGDFISQYHEETRDAYARHHPVRFEYRLDDYHRHAATSIEETLEFHLRAFADPTLDNVPVRWSYSSPFRHFRIHDFTVEIEGDEKGLVYLRDVEPGGFRLLTRRWAPDGPPVAGNRIRMTTGPFYKAGAEYRIQQLDLSTRQRSDSHAVATADGRLRLELGPGNLQLGIVGPGTGASPPVLLPPTSGDRLYCPSGRELQMPIRLFNPRGDDMGPVSLELSSAYPTVEMLDGTVRLDGIEPGGVADLSAEFRVRFVAGADGPAPARLHLRMVYDGWHEHREEIDVAIIPEGLPRPVAFEVMDGRTLTFPVFRQAGNRGGGSAVEREVTEGRGNGNGVPEPGEEFTLWVRLDQGLDPFDRGNWYRTKIRTESPWVEIIADLEETKQREWTGAMNRTSVLRLRPETPSGTRIPLLLENESWSFHFTPDVRLGAEPMYQAVQLHRLHLHRLELIVP